MSAAWTPEEWARIERIARAERAQRPWARDALVHDQRRRIARAIANGAALELRQWADVAEGRASQVWDSVISSLLDCA